MKLVRVPLRISFAGGGSDLPSHFEEHGGAVLSTTISKYIYITAKPNISLYPHRYRLVYSKVEELVHRGDIQHPIIKQLVNDYSIAALDLDVMSDIPAGTGMGSSSAFTVGLHKALGYGFTPHSLAEAACNTEVMDLKEPIGFQDQYAAAFGGLNYFRFTKGRVDVTPIPLQDHEINELEKSLYLIYLGGTRDASKLLKEQHTGTNTETLKAMALYAKDAAMALQRGQISELGYIIRDGWELKRSLSPNVSNERIDTLISTAIQHGATGGKLLGAGGSGFVLLFCPVDSHVNMLNGLRHLSPQYVDFKLTNKGAEVLYDSVN